MDLPAEVQISNELIGMKGGRATLVAISNLGYYELRVAFNGRNHKVLLPTASTAVVFPPARSRSSPPTSKSSSWRFFHPPGGCLFRLTRPRSRSISMRSAGGCPAGCAPRSGGSPAADYHHQLAAAGDRGVEQVALQEPECWVCSGITTQGYSLPWLLWIDEA